MNRNNDWIITISAILTSIIGLVALLSTSITTTGEVLWQGTFLKQIIFVVIGLVIYWAISKFDYTYFKHIQVAGIIYIAVLLLLIITLIWGTTVNAAKRWLVIAGFQIQPSEFAKIAIIILTASILQLKNRYNQYLLAGISFLPALLMAILIYVQPHGSMAIILMALWFLTVFTCLDKQLFNLLISISAFAVFAGIVAIFFNLTLFGVISLLVGLFVTVLNFAIHQRFRKFIVIAFGVIVSAGLVFGVLWNSVLWKSVIFQHQKDRIVAFINPEETASAEGFNVDQAKVAIGSGQIFGKGFGYGTQSKLHFLPEFQTDFIFASYCEEFGLVGAMILLILLATLVYRIFYHSLKLKGSFEASVLLVLGLKILIEIFINIGTNTGIIPATGIPLPLVSAGGSITITTFLALGIIQSIINSKVDNSLILD
ncbi:MAG TPA: rod shape-determining protein RodA [Candidatus Dojkabacteria bacterium]|nr:rod shape-determining protein RodA [Candidatus Dojkabacteria bacterium]